MTSSCNIPDPITCPPLVSALMEEIQFHSSFHELPEDVKTQFKRLFAALQWAKPKDIEQQASYKWTCALWKHLFLGSPVPEADAIVSPGF